MSAPTVNGSRPAPDVDAYMPAARDLAYALDRVPGQRELREQLRVASDKATEIRRRLAADEQSWLAAAPDVPEPAGEPGEPEAAEQPPTGDVPPQATRPAAAIPARTPWWLLGLIAPAFVAIWSGWVGLGGLTGFGPVHLLPGIADRFEINTAITLPIGMETYAAYALKVWLSPNLPRRARKFAKRSAIGSLLLGAAGQIAYHVMTAAGWTHAPWLITALVACLPVGVLGMGAALAHLLRNGEN